jgi:hypothetical protein
MTLFSKEKFCSSYVSSSKTIIALWAPIFALLLQTESGASDEELKTREGM